MPDNITYTNARGEVIVLDHTEWDGKWLWNIYGSEGLEAPEIEYQDIVYADGSVETVVINMKPRDVTLYFVVKTKSISDKYKFEEMKKQLIQSGVKAKPWGQLMIRRHDGRKLLLNCVYTGGLDEFIRKYPQLNKFSLSFHAENPLFLNTFATKYIIQADDAEGYLMMQPLEFEDGYDFSKDNMDDNPGGLYMMDLEDPENDNSDANPNAVYMHSAANESGDKIELDSQKVYPTITISGGAKNIRLYNSLTGKKIEFSSDIVVDGANSIMIETKPLHKKVVQVNEQTGAETNIIGKLTPDSDLDFYLDRGLNVIYFRNSEATPDSKCTFSYTEGFLSAE